jgi:hypothetical protein
MRIVVLTAPPAMSARRALRKLGGIDPDAAYDFNHIYFASAAGEASAAAWRRCRVPSSRAKRAGGPTSRFGRRWRGRVTPHCVRSLRTITAAVAVRLSLPTARPPHRAGRGFNDAEPTASTWTCTWPTCTAADWRLNRAVIHGLAWLMQEKVRSST